MPARRDGEHLEQLAHRIRSGEALDLACSRSRVAASASGAELAGAFREAHAEQEIALRA